jgi:putative DNA methylase
VLAFSFHHSRVEGWAAIYEAVKSAGLFIVAAHPVHAELRAASPKAAAGAPISLDAILVCKKDPLPYLLLPDDHEAIVATKALAERLSHAGISVSTADVFVILASQMLISLSQEPNNFDSFCSKLTRAYRAVGQAAVEEKCIDR